jgi:uncharacterized protein with FMN-binding domain
VKERLMNTDRARKPEPETRQPASYRALIGLSLMFSILAVVTLLPNPNASKPNVLGYRSVCSFAPAATALCGLLAGITCTVRNRVFSRRAASARYSPFIVPAAVGLLLSGIALASGLRFAAVQSRFQAVIRETAATDASAAASSWADAGSAATAADASSAASGNASAGGSDGFADGTRRAEAGSGEVRAVVEAVVSAGRITDLRLIDGVNMEKRLVETLFGKVIEGQTTEVEAVSGATASSNVLLEAVRKAAEGR